MADNSEEPQGLHGRTFERSRGCWSCVSYDCSERIRQLYKDRTQSERAQIVAGVAPELPKLTRDNPHVRQIAKRSAEFMAQGFSATAATNRALAEVGGGNSLIAQQIRAMRQESTRFTMFDRMAEQGLIGVCIKGRAEADFVTAPYLCDSWVGREGSSVATEGQPLDLLPEELADEHN